jgi:single-strand DNA-binding protein
MGRNYINYNGMGRDEEEVNQVQLIGRLTHDPELKYLPQGMPIVKFRLAVNRNKDEADFINCIAFNKVAENLANYQKKGSRIAIVGKIQTGSYENQQGQRIYTTEIVANTIEFLDSRSEQQNGQNSAPNYQPSTNYQSQHPNANTGQYGGQNQQYNNQQNYSRVDEDPFASSKGPIEVKEDDLPF